MTPQKRPAENSTSVAGAIVALVVAIWHVKDTAIVAPLIVVVSNVPRAASWIVDKFRAR